MKQSSILQSIVEKLIINGTLVNSPGLLYGKMGIALFFFHYAKYTSNELFENYALDLIEIMQKQMYINMSPNYDNGIAGIGVGINYLIQNDFIETDDVFFNELDQQMHKVTMCDLWNNLHLYDGLIGYGRYWICRWNKQSQLGNEAIIHILDSIEYRLLSLTYKEQQDTFCFLHDLSEIPEFTEKVKKLKHQLAKNNLYSSKMELYRLCGSLIKRPLTVSLLKKYFDLQVNDPYINLTETAAPAAEECMGIYNGFAGYGLCQLAISDMQHSGWMNLM